MLKVICLILVIHCVTSQSISRMECHDMSDPHLMRVGRMNGGNFYPTGQGTLISENYVLTSSGTVRFRRSAQEDFNLRTLKLMNDQYSNNRLFDVHRVIEHESNGQPFSDMNDIALMQLTQSVPFQSTTSNFGRACIWTDSTEPSNTFQLYGSDPRANQNHRVTVSREFSTEPMDECTSTSRHYSFSDNGHSHSENVVTRTENSRMCLGLQRDFNVPAGSPIMYKQGNKNFVYGVMGNTDTNRNGNTGLGTKVGNHIDWIESNVWPNNGNLCGKRNIVSTPLMFHGQSTYHGQFPWHVGLFKNRKYSCGGTIISKTAILTAAHCVQDDRGVIPPNRLTVVAGTHRINEYPVEAKIYAVKNITIHENYSRSQFKNDIAIVKVSELIEFSDFIQPICISDNLPFIDFPNGTVAGWGSTEHNNNSDVLIQVTLPVLSTSACLDHRNRAVIARYLNEKIYCAGILNGTNVGAGDSGGGMVFEFQSQWYLRGIVSLGLAIPKTGQLDPLQVAFFSDVPLFYDWIREHENEDN